MRTKLLEIPSGKWFRLDDRPDREAVVEIINELKADGYKFTISHDGNRFMRNQICLFEWAAQNPDGVEIKTINLQHGNGYELYHNGKLIAIK